MQFLKGIRVSKILGSLALALLVQLTPALAANWGFVGGNNEIVIYVDMNSPQFENVNGKGDKSCIGVGSVSWSPVDEQTTFLFQIYRRDKKVAVSTYKILDKFGNPVQQKAPPSDLKTLAFEPVGNGTFSEIIYNWLLKYYWNK